MFWSGCKHKWVDLGRSNIKLSVRKVVHTWVDEEESEQRYEIIHDVPHICILQKCEACGDARTFNLEGSMPDSLLLPVSAVASTRNSA